MNAIYLYKASHYFYRKKLKLLSKLIDAITYLVHNSYIPGGCDIGERTVFAYKGIGVVIHSDAKIGNDCLIGQGITIGGKGGDDELPVVENNVYIGAGVRILGEVTIGHNSIIAPNSVILKDVEPFSVVGGIPGKLISKITKDNFKGKYELYYGQNDYYKE